LFFFLLVQSALAEKPPSKKTITSWWKSQSSEAMDIVGDPVEVRLKNKEIAYLVPVLFSRGRNDMWRVVMVRPTLKEVQEVDDPVRSVVEVHDLDHDGVSEVVVSASGSLQGTIQGVRAIVQFEGWYPVVLHEETFSDNSAAWGENDVAYESRTVTWKFVDLNKDGSSDLVEEITTERGREHGGPTRESMVSRFLFKSMEFVPYPNGTDAKKN
jgi:hypothetical protein